MEHQKSISGHPLLINTSRQFYSKRIASRPHSYLQVDKILKILQNQNQKKSIIRLKTQQKEQVINTAEIELDNMLKIAKFKLQNLIKKQSSDWKELFDLFQKYKKSTSIQIIRNNELNILHKMAEIIKNNPKPNKMQECFPSKTKDKAQTTTSTQRNKFSLQHIKLFKQNQLLKQKIQNYHQSQSNNYTSSTYIKTTSNLQIKQSIGSKKLLNQISDLDQEIQEFRQSNNLLRQQKKALLLKITELKNNNQNLCDQILRARNNSSENLHKYESWRNIMSMQNEQILSLKRDINDLKKDLFSLNSKYQITLKRINKLSANNQNQLTQISKRSVEIFTEQIQSFQKVRNMFNIKSSYSTTLGTQKQQKKVTYHKFLSEKQTLKNSQGIKKMNKDYFRYYRPNFFTYLQKYFEYQGVDRQNFEQINLSVGMTFLTTIRTILDCKHNEYLMAKNVNKQFTSLSNFTLSWLSNFKVEEKTKKITEINNDICFQTIGVFYTRLMSQNLNNNWQIITFRQFLLDSLTLDELIFYLKARFILMKGDCLSDGGGLEQIYYSNYLDALVLIQEVVSDFDYRKKLEDFVKKSVQFQRKKQLIDANFILRLLLEYYQYKKSKIFSSLFKTFNNFSRDKNQSMPFQYYLKIYDYNFFEMSLIDKVQIYQKAFSLGKGIVSLEYIFTVLNEEGYLCCQVQKMFRQHSVYKNMSQINIQALHPSENIQLIESFYGKLLQKSIVQEIPLLGVQKLKQLSNRLRATKNLSYQIILARFSFINSIFMLNFKKLLYSKKIKQEQFYSYFPMMIKYYTDLGKITLQKKQFLGLIIETHKKNAAKIIWRFYKRKKNYLTRNYQIVEQTVKNDKAAQIRRQFLNMIDNLKQKYNTNLTSVAQQTELI